MNIHLLRSHLHRANLRRDLPEPEERRRVRIAAGLTQRAVADVLGVSDVAVCRWETGEREPGPEHAADYAELLRYLSADQQAVSA